ncbi:MAG: hypothetical protein O3C40_03725 [Planctomycetota bacterium]|nr:hypothetical protein [Planctomycetota bacterium]
MKSIPLALTWEFWRQSGFGLFTVVALLFGQTALMYGVLRLDKLSVRDDFTLASLHVFGFIFVVVGLAAVVCHSTSSPQYRFTLPVSIRASILVPVINGAIATVVGYLAVALLVNWVFNAEWSLLKPTIIAVCVISVCQAVAGMFWSSSNLRGTIGAGVGVVLGVVVVLLNGIDAPDREQFIREWHTIRPLDISLAILVPIAACTFSLVVCTLARRGQIFSMSAIGRWLLAMCDVGFGSGTHAATPMAAELWSEWTRRGRVLLAGPILIAATLCGFFLSGRYDWQYACDAIVTFTWMQVMIGSILGLFIGHVGERFDFQEHLATRPLSDTQLADVKLRIALKLVCWTWIIWAVGVAVAVVCLAMVGQGPKSWSYIVPPGNPLSPIINVVMIPRCSWTLTSLGVSIVILRPWMVKVVFGTIALLPTAPFGLLYLMPEAGNQILAAVRWGWFCLSIVGTVALYVMAFRLRLITAKRVAIVGMSYLLFCATWLVVLSYLPSIEIPRPLVVGFLLSNCILPFVCIAAVPLAIWWNRHR